MEVKLSRGDIEFQSSGWLAKHCQIHTFPLNVRLEYTGGWPCIRDISRFRLEVVGESMGMGMGMGMGDF